MGGGLDLVVVVIGAWRGEVLDKHRRGHVIYCIGVSVLLLKVYRTFIRAGHTFFVLFLNHAIIFGASELLTLFDVISD